MLVRKGRVAEIAVYGGAAIMLQFEVAFCTAGVDAKVETGDHGARNRPIPGVSPSLDSSLRG
jgi:hypothetical protein